MRVGAIIPARLDSTRLKRKALIKIQNKPLIEYVFDLCKKVAGLDEIILATSDRQVDNELAEFTINSGIQCVRGDVHDVAGRFLAAMKSHKLDAALRVNGDSPLNRPDLLTYGVRIFLSQPTVDLVTNVPQRTYPFGVSLEVVGLNAMERVCHSDASTEEREHITQYIYNHAKDFKIETIVRPDTTMSNIQLAVDSSNDLQRFEWIVSNSVNALNLSLPELVRQAQNFEKNH